MYVFRANYLVLNNQLVMFFSKEDYFFHSQHSWVECSSLCRAKAPGLPPATLKLDLRSPQERSHAWCWQLKQWLSVSNVTETEGELTTAATKPAQSLTTFWKIVPVATGKFSPHASSWKFLFIANRKPYRKLQPTVMGQQKSFYVYRLGPREKSKQLHSAFQK